MRKNTVEKYCGKYCNLDDSLTNWMDNVRIINIFTYGRGGSGLLSSLLDGHPSVIAFPDTILMGFQDWWDTLYEKDAVSILEDFLDLYEVLFDPTFIHPTRKIPGCGSDFGWSQNYVDRNTGCAKPGFSIPKNKFIESMFLICKGVENISASQFFKLLHVGLARAIDYKIGSGTVIVNGLHMPDEGRACFIREGFKNVQNVHMVREPVLSHVSWWKSGVRHNQHSDYPEMEKFVQQMINHHAPICGWETNSIAVRLEDLHSRPEKTMKKLLEWLDLPWHDNVLKATFFSTSWSFDDTGMYVSPFNTSIVSPDRHNDLLDSFDHYRLARVAKLLYVAWDYQMPKKPSLLHRLFLPFKNFRIEKFKKSSFKSKVKVRMLLYPTLYNIIKAPLLIMRCFFKRNESGRLVPTIRFAKISKKSTKSTKKPVQLLVVK